MMIIYKLTKPDLTTHGGFKWVLGEWRETSGEGDLCGPGWLHCYHDPDLAVVLNPIHANLPEFILCRGEAEGKCKPDHGLKWGYAKMRILEQVEPRKIATAQRVRFAILCAKHVCNDPEWNRWADNWLSGKDRTGVAAWAALVAAWAALAAAWTAAGAAARDDAWAATGAARAAAWTAAGAAARDAAWAATGAARTAAWAAKGGATLDLPALLKQAIEEEK